MVSKYHVILPAYVWAAAAPQRTEEADKAWKLPCGWVPGVEDSRELQLYETVNCMRTHSTAKIWQLAGQDPVFDPQSFRFSSG